MDPFENYDLISSFIDDNFDDFIDYCRDRHISKDYYCDYEFDYVLARENQYLEYAALVKEEDEQGYTGDEGFYE